MSFPRRATARRNARSTARRRPSRRRARTPRPNPAGTRRAHGSLASNMNVADVRCVADRAQGDGRGARSGRRSNRTSNRALPRLRACESAPRRCAAPRSVEHERRRHVLLPLLSLVEPVVVLHEKHRRRQQEHRARCRTDSAESRCACPARESRSTCVIEAPTFPAASVARKSTREWVVRHVDGTRGGVALARGSVSRYRTNTAPAKRSGRRRRRWPPGHP